MTYLSRIERKKHPIRASFEFSPPKTPEMEDILWSSIERLSPLSPSFVSVTYGAGGSTRDRTHATVKRMLDETDLKPAAHLTCVNASREEVDEVIHDYWDIGVRHIVALRGDPPGGVGLPYVPFDGGYENGAALVKGIRDIGDFEVSVSAYPEKHPDSTDWDEDLDNLKRKIDNGATRAITQFFFEPKQFLQYLERVRKAGIEIPIVPGVMLFSNFRGIVKMAGGTNVTIPDWLVYRFEDIDEDVTTRKLVGASVAADLCAALYDEGIEDFHLYTLNRPDLTYAICHILGMRPFNSSQNEE